MLKSLMSPSPVGCQEHRARRRKPVPRSWLCIVTALLLASPLLASCAEAPAESRIASNTITVDRLDTSWILGNRTIAPTIIVEPLADAQSHLSDSASVLLTTDNGLSLLSFIVSCALPADAVIIATLDGNEIELFGAHGLAPQWRTAPLDLAGQRWVSACLFARVNAHSVAVPLSARGPNLGLAADGDERAIFTAEEGAFYGNAFVPADQPIQWFGCRGRDQLAGETGGLRDRDCAEPDLAKPGLTQCGFTFTGECGSFVGERACESFSTRGTFYQRCHTGPGHPGSWEGAAFEQVITTFVVR